MAFQANKGYIFRPKEGSFGSTRGPLFSIKGDIRPTKNTSMFLRPTWERSQASIQLTVWAGCVCLSVCICLWPVSRPLMSFSKKGWPISTKTDYYLWKKLRPNLDRYDPKPKNEPNCIFNYFTLVIQPTCRIANKNHRKKVLFKFQSFFGFHV